MESSTPPIATANPGSGLDSNQAIAQDPLALPNELHVGYPNSAENNGQDQPTTTTTQSNTNNSNSDKNLDGSMSTNTTSNNGAIYSNAESSHHQGMQYDTAVATTTNQIGNSHHHQHYGDVRQLNHLHQHMSMPQHETHKTFSHSIENLSKTTEKCPPNDMKM